MVFGRKPKLQVDLQELPDEKGRFISYLQAALKVPIHAIESKVVVESQNTPPQELQRIVTKFIYKRNLNNVCYVSLDDGIVKVQTFKSAVKKHQKQKKDTLHQTAVQSWGL